MHTMAPHSRQMHSPIRKFPMMSTGSLTHTVCLHSEDPRQWLEEVEGDEALKWVRERNSEAVRRHFLMALF